jgi:DNA mismatch endonuclease, patch repair protein
MDSMTKEQRSRTMSLIRSARTNFENRIVLELTKRGIRCQRNYSAAIGKPDIALPRQRKAVFLHSDFWHGWRLPAWERILPNEFWKKKLHKNRRRDKSVVRRLRRADWKVLVVWEHQIERDFDASIRRIVRFLREF